MTKTAFSILLLLLIIAGVVASSCSNGNTKQSDRAGGGKGGSAIPVEVYIVTPQPLENKISTTGTLLANEEVELRPEIAGRITSVSFAEGKRVKKGEVLLRINDRELRAQLERKSLEEKLAADQEHRSKRLLDVAAISQEDYDKVLNALKMIQAEREVIESQLAETVIAAPFDGVVGLRSVSEGQYVDANTLVAAMQDIDPIKVEFAVPEKYAGLLTDGTKVGVMIGDAIAAQTGVIYAIEAKIDPNTRTIKARATIPNPNGTLIPGSFAKVEVTLERIGDALVVPGAAVIPELNGNKVFVARNGKAQAVPIQTGIRTESSIQVTDGLRAFDTLIVTGLLQLSDGKAIQISPAAAK